MTFGPSSTTPSTKSLPNSLPTRAPLGGFGSATSDASKSVEMVDLVLLAILLIAPLFFGGRDDLGRLALVAMASTAGLVWLWSEAQQANPRWNASPSYWLAGAIAVVGVVQLVPLPSPLIATLAPRAQQLLPTWSPDVQGAVHIGRWETLSLAPSESRIALAMALAYATLFIVVAQRLRSVQDVWRLLRALGLASLLMAAFGLVQYFAGNGLYFWFYEVADRTTDVSPVGPFLNRNHFAHFVALGVGPLLAWLFACNIAPPGLRSSGNGSPGQRSSRHGSSGRHASGRRSLQSAAGPSASRRESSAEQADAPRWLPTGLGIAVALAAFAVMLSMSRGGAVALTVATTTLSGLLWWKGVFAGFHARRLAILGCVVCCLLIVHGFDDVLGRLDDFAAGSLDEMDRSSWRRKIWTANLAAFRDGWQTGWGGGSHANVYPVYFPQSIDFEFTHAESSVLQIATEYGLPGLLLLAASATLAVVWCAGSLRSANDRDSICCAATLTACLAASGLHACVDFVWHIPACMTLTVLLLAGALRLYQLTMAQPCTVRSLGSSGWTALVALTIACGIWSMGTLWGPALASHHWNGYRLAYKAAMAERLQQWREGTKNEATGDRLQDEFFDRTMIEKLTSAVERHPGHARAHLRLAKLYLRRFDARQQQSDNAMTAENVRDAAIDAQFASPSLQRAWLKRALGENALLLQQAHYHVRQSLRHAPLQGEAYLTLAQLCHLNGWNQTGVDALLDQAHRLRPQDGDVLFEVGRRRAWQGDEAGAFEAWTDAYRDPGDHQRRIVETLAGHLPAAVFLHHFRPTWQTLRDVWLRYRRQGNAEDWGSVIDYARSAAGREAKVSVDDANQIWMRLVEMCLETDRRDDALYAVRQAFRAAPDEPRIRLTLAQLLVESNDAPGAVNHLRWYLARRPGDAYAEKLLMQCAKAKTPSNVLRR